MRQADYVASKSEVISSNPDFVSLSALLQEASSVKLEAAQLGVMALNRDELLSRFRRYFASGKRLPALIIADALINLVIPPCFWHHHLSKQDYSINQKFDLMVYDLRWMRRHHAEHWKSVRYGRYKQLWAHSEPTFHHAAEFAFFQGKRAAWEIVRSLSMSDAQQFDCVRLRSAPIVRRSDETSSKRDKIFAALQLDMDAVRRTKTFTDDDAKKALLRRHALWLCYRMTDGSPSVVAIRYEQLTGENISRQVAAKQIEKIKAILCEHDLTISGKKR